jgi:hypothetical protein
MGNYNFKQDITLGELGEEIIIKDLESMGGEFINDNKDNKYDIIMNMPNGEVKYEIKTDIFCMPIADTGNIFVEIECRGKDSGLMVTEAKWFVNLFLYLKEAWYIESDKLKELIENNDFKLNVFSGDANSNTKGYLIPRKDVREHFIVRDIPKEWVK